jgi:16S rRNA (guanine966-N2)-methyltransferase
MRVTGGVLRGRRLRTPAGASVRPTSDRVREALFSSLGDVAAAVLDLYAGSGALGIEALSRGAATACFVERAPRSLTALRSNLEALGVEERTQIRRGEVAAVLRQLDRHSREGEEVRDPAPERTACPRSVRFELVFLDPPYESGEASRALRLLADSGILSQSARVVVETGRRTPPPKLEAFDVTFERRYGDVLITIFAPVPAGRCDESVQPEARSPQ